MLVVIDRSIDRFFFVMVALAPHGFPMYHAAPTGS
jgi:hypothetical protein